MHTVLLAIDPCLTELDPRVAGDVDLINKHDCNADQTISNIQNSFMRTRPCRRNREIPGDQVLPTFCSLFMYNEAMDPRQLSCHVRFDAAETYWTPWTEMTRLQIKIEKAPEITKY